MSGIFDENNMMHALEKYVPNGEKIRAGIHACAFESQVNAIFSGCVLDEITVLPSNRGGEIKVRRTKYATCDIYLGVTSRCLVMAECGENRHLYEFDADLDPEVVAVTEVREVISLKDMGTCYPLEEIREVKIKKAWMGSVKCNITMKNGDYFKLMFPKLGGLGGGMPHHKQYREEIIACLSKQNV